jgi:hypothetical protein
MSLEELSAQAYMRLCGLGFKPKKIAGPEIWYSENLGLYMYPALLGCLESIPTEDLPVYVHGNYEIFLERNPEIFSTWLKINPMGRDTFDYYGLVVRPYLEARLRVEYSV